MTIILSLILIEPSPQVKTMLTQCAAAAFVFASKYQVLERNRQRNHEKPVAGISAVSRKAVINFFMLLAFGWSFVNF